MTFENVKELIDILDKSGINEFSMNFENLDIYMNKSSISKSSKRSKTEAEVLKVDDMNSIVKQDINENLKDESSDYILSPLVGTYYSASSEECEAFVKIGTKVKKGDVLCIIETMKIMNEILSDYDGKISEIYLNNEDNVEFEQKLFKIV